MNNLLVKRFDDLVLKTFLTRPIGGAYLTILTELKKIRSFIYFNKLNVLAFISFNNL